MISTEDIVQINNIELSIEDINICKEIAKNTANTWQSNRSQEEILKDTYLGKFAEKALKQFFNNECMYNINMHVAFYDDFRTDNFKHHNSIDFIFSKSIDNLIKAQLYIQENLSFKNAKLNEEQILKFKNGNINICEIKATRINDRLITDENINFNKLLTDDFLTYPKFMRKSSILNTQEYFETISASQNISKEDILNKELNNLCDWYFRVYIKENANNDFICDAYIVGALPGIEFINNFNIKKMSKENKSEAAIYLSVPLKNGISIKSFKKNNIPTYNHKNHLSSLFNNDIKNNNKIKPK